MYRELTPKERQEFLQWARDNFEPHMKINPLWHPVVKKEIARLQFVHLLNELFPKYESKLL